MSMQSVILGRTPRSKYLWIGLLLSIFKFQVDRWLTNAGFDRSWTWYNYLAPGLAEHISALNGQDQKLAVMLIAVALPFIAAGTVLTTRRLRDAGLPQSLTLLFFVPVVNIFLFLTLSIVPSKAANEERARSPQLSLLLPKSKFGSALAGVVGAAIVSLVLAGFATEFLHSYGWGLFLGIPFMAGFISSVITSIHGQTSLKACIAVATLSVTLQGLLLVAFALEGVICIAMAFPIAAPLAWLGAWLGWAVSSVPSSRSEVSCAAMILVAPLLLYVEGQSGSKAEVAPVTTSVLISAPRDTVWKNVVEFSSLPEPTELIFRAGIAYPTHATIEGRGVGAVRKCQFSTGPFVEPITVWDEPHRLAFSVTSQPPPMNELSIWKELSPPHLDGLLVSRGGEFRLTELGPNETLLEGTTWYSNQMWPEWYWRVWSDWLIHKIHLRVLRHIDSESQAKNYQGTRDES